MKRTVEMARAGIPSAKPGAVGQITPNRYGWFLKAYKHHAMIQKRVKTVVSVVAAPKIPWYRRIIKWLTT